MVNDCAFSILLVGDTTGANWTGKFKAKTVLSHRDYIRKDQVRRQLLGTMGGSPDDRSTNIAFACSELSVRLTDAPKWWQESDNGLDLLDDNVLMEVLKEAFRVEREAFEEKKKAAEAAKDTLKEEIKKDLPTIPENKLP